MLLVLSGILAYLPAAGQRTWMTAPVRQSYVVDHKADPGPDDVESYIPYNAAYFPMRRVRIALHIFSKDDGSGNLPDNAAAREYINRVINHCNWSYADIEKPRPASQDSAYVLIRDSRIRFILDTVYYHYDTDAWDFAKYTNQANTRTKDTFFNEGAAFSRCEDLYRKYVTEAPGLSGRRKDSTLHVFFLENDKFKGKGMADRLYTNRWVYLSGTYYNYSHDPKNPNHWSSGELLAHELGHALGLHHPFDFAGIADLPSTYRGQSNNVMDYWPSQGRALTPLQLGMLHLGLSGREGKVMKVVIPDWRTYRPDSVVFIPAGDTVHWTGDKFFCCDIVIEPGAVLILKSNLTLPAGAQVRVRKNGTLIVDGGLITTDGDQPWAGVRLVKPKRFLFFGGRSLSSLEFRNGGRLEKAAEPVKEVAF